MWRFLVTLQSFPASTGRFYLVSLISQNTAHRVRIELTTSGFGVQIATIGIPVCMCSMLGSNQLFPWLEARRTTSYAYAAKCTRGRDQTYDLLDVSQPLLSLSYASMYVAEAGIEPDDEAYETSQSTRTFSTAVLMDGFEPPTTSVSEMGSTPELHQYFVRPHGNDPCSPA